MVQNKMATARLGLEIWALTSIPERADVGDGSRGERGTSETLDLPVTVSRLMTSERKYAFEPYCVLFASLIRRLLRNMLCCRHFVLYQGVAFFIKPVSQIATRCDWSQDLRFINTDSIYLKQPPTKNFCTFRSQWFVLFLLCLYIRVTLHDGISKVFDT